VRPCTLPSLPYDRRAIEATLDRIEDRLRDAPDGLHSAGPPASVEAVAASIKLPFDAGMRKERDIFLALMMTPESKALRHVFMAERAASKIPDVPEDTPQRKIEKVAVIGAGTMGGGISMNFLNAGIPVTILEMKQEALDRGVGVMRSRSSPRGTVG